MKKKFLPFLEFSDQWIEENVPDFYTTLKEDMRGFVAMVIRQHHSGGSLGMFLALIQKLMQDYYSQ